MRILLILVYCFFTFFSFAQNKAYKDSLETYLKKYVQEHEVVTGKDKEFMAFFPANEKFRVVCSFERKKEAPWFRMETSGLLKKNYRVYGTIHFKINDTIVVLNVYQSQDLMSNQQYRDYLFIPFTDATTGAETYSSGRYIDIEIKDIVNDKVIIDFNRAYNPYCAYLSGKYNCPIPPAENHLAVSITAGEKAFGKPH